MATTAARIIHLILFFTLEPRFLRIRAQKASEADILPHESRFAFIIKCSKRQFKGKNVNKMTKSKKTGSRKLREPVLRLTYRKIPW
jgi:hypothetical protein